MSRGAWVIAWAVVTFPLVGFWSYGLFDLDEGIYAASLREMLERGDWIVVTYNGAPFLEKPILIYWIAGCFLKAGLPGEVALRLGSVLATLGTMAATSRFALVHFGDRVGVWSLIILGCSVLFMGVGSMFIPDALFVFFLCVSLYALWESVQRGARWRMLSGLALGLATLAKGPVAMVVFALLALYVFVRMPACRSKLRGGWLSGAILFLIPVGAWYLPVAISYGGELFREFVVFQNIGRIRGLDTAHLGPFYFYVPIVVLALAPFTAGLWGSWAKIRARPVEVYLWAWVVIVFGLFSIAGSKLPHYILPLLPPLAILLAAYFGRAPNAMRFAPAAFAVVLVAISLFAASAFPRYSTASLYVAVAAFIGLLGSLLVQRHGFLISATVSQWPVVVAVLLLSLPAYWRTEYVDVHKAARVARSRGQPVVEFRTEGWGATLATSHPSTRWYYGRPDAEGTWLDELARLPLGTTVVSRRGRIGQGQQQALRLLDKWCAPVAISGEFEVYEVRGLGAGRE